MEPMGWLTEDFLSTAWSEACTRKVWEDWLDPIERRLESEESQGFEVFPNRSQILRALRETEPDDVRALILGQDPYHTPGYAMGLAFAVPRDVTPKAPSLKNMIRELNPQATDFDSELTAWRTQGVLLLNTTLTVRCGEAASHSSLGWEPVIQACLKLLNRGDRKVALLWGRHAQRFEAFLDPKVVVPVHSAHPSPLSAHRGFLGSDPYGRANAVLGTTRQGPLNWTAVLNSTVSR